ncbi:MAG: hypothetical protein GF353_06310 [Candidatus Lokiarchaeota archaeon]|nr:hypothetical protein [Candidatus Lokiarchaeota archaeon]
MNDIDQIPHWKTIYASPRFGSSFILDITDFIIFFVYINWFTLPPFAAGLAVMFGKFSIGITQFFIGHISDKTNVKWKNLGFR